MMRDLHQPKSQSMAKVSNPRKSKRVSGVVSFQEPWICGLSLLWVHILNRDQQVDEVVELPSQVHLEDLIQHAQEAVGKSSPEKDLKNKIKSPDAQNNRVEEGKLTRSCRAIYHDSITNSQLNLISAREIKEFFHQAKKIL